MSISEMKKQRKACRTIIPNFEEKFAATAHLSKKRKKKVAPKKKEK